MNDLDPEWEQLIKARNGAKEALAKIIAAAEQRGRTAALEEAAEACVVLFRNAPNTSESGFHQNKISHGCIESAAAIRAIRRREEKAT